METKGQKEEDSYPEFDELLKRVGSRVQKLASKGTGMFMGGTRFIKIVPEGDNKYLIRSFDPDWPKNYAEEKHMLVKDNQGTWHMLDFFSHEYHSTYPALGMGASGGIESGWEEYTKHYMMEPLKRLSKTIEVCKPLKIVDEPSDITSPPS